MARGNRVGTGTGSGVGLDAEGRANFGIDDEDGPTLVGTDDGDVAVDPQVDLPGPDTRPGYRCGVVAIAGRPNVGKSTLLNRLLGMKIAIVTPKPQTTRDRILGILSRPNFQALFTDTPGIHDPKKPLNRRMVQEALAALQDADVVLVVTDAVTPEDVERDRFVLDRVRESGKPAVLALNKIDKIAKPKLLPLLAAYSRVLDFAAIVPVSALKGDGLDPLLAEVSARLPEGRALFPEDDLSDRPLRFLASELVREKLTLFTYSELPYSVAVTIDRFEEPEPPLAARISATIHVERDSQKAIVIGHGGEMLKRIGTAAREEIEELVGRKVMLELFVRVDEQWAGSDEGVKRMGYE